MKGFLKGLFSTVMVVVIGLLGMVEILIEVVFQLVRLIKRGYGSLLNGLMRKIEPIYNGKLRLKIQPKEDKDEEIRIYDFEDL